MFAQTPTPGAHDYDINQRKGDQQGRIANGVKSGQLTAGETSRLEHQEAGINSEERGMRAQDNGHLTKQDRQTDSRTAEPGISSHLSRQAQRSGSLTQNKWPFRQERPLVLSPPQRYKKFPVEFFLPLSSPNLKMTWSWLWRRLKPTAPYSVVYKVSSMHRGIAANPPVSVSVQMCHGPLCTFGVKDCSDLVPCLRPIEKEAPCLHYPIRDSTYCPTSRKRHHLFQYPYPLLNPGCPMN